jgi:hypothetical protein
LLILEIFAQRARSHEGKLQVELARLQYLSTRLVRRWSHLERQRGGIGTRGGPGETQIELDRRMIGDHIKRTKERLLKVKRQRQTQRRQRDRRDAFNISLVGYTNAGKSSLFNSLVNARAYAADQLFATLDTTTRQLYLGEAGRSVSLSDTVGFHPQPAARPDRCLRGHLAGGGRRRRVAACRRCIQPAPSGADERSGSGCWPRSAPNRCRRFWCSTSSMPLKWAIGPCIWKMCRTRAVCRLDHRLFVSARTGEGLDGLRRHLARLAGRAPASDAGEDYSLPARLRPPCRWAQSTT